MSQLTVHRNWIIQSSDITLGREIGRGSFGVVYKSTYQHMDVAIKKIASAAGDVERELAANY